MRSEDKRQFIWSNSSPHRKFEDGIRYVMQPGGPGAPGNWVNLETASDSKLDDMMPIDERPRPPRERPKALPPLRHDRLSPGEYDRQARQTRVPPAQPQDNWKSEVWRTAICKEVAVLQERADQLEQRAAGAEDLEQRAKHLEQRISHLEDIIDYIVGISDVWRDRWSPADEE